MKNNNSVKVSLCLLALLSIAAPVFAQRGRKPVIFAVVNDGKWVEPIAFIEKGKLVEPVGGDADAKDLLAFTNAYFKPKSSYRLIFGGANAGAAVITSSDPKADCSKNMAQVSVTSTKTKLGGFVMALATDAAATKKAVSGLRRKPNWAERTEIDALVRAEFTNQKVSAAALKTLNYHNLTALDVNNDKKPELIGSFWVNTSDKERGLLFFIAEKNSAGKYELVLSDYKIIKQDEVMSGEIKALDTGFYHELLIDTFDYDNDGTGEIFTYVQGFEGAGFFAYKRTNGKWEKAFEGSNYHCAY